ncbi:MAG: flavodoxin family protein [Firmicutes bacterium]|nr:flavodoxin family protein [Bacillota bacterium]
MKIIAINGSHRKNKNTAVLLRAVLDEAAAQGASTELLELADHNIKFCISCNKCLGRNQCTINDDDMNSMAEKLLAADGIVLGSPVYWGNVTAMMKNFMDRSRWMHMYKNMLAGKAGAAVTNAGLRNGGQDLVLQIMEHYLSGQGIQLVDARDQNAPLAFTGVSGSLQADFKEGKNIWRRSVEEDEGAMKACRQLGRNMVKTVKSFS